MINKNLQNQFKYHTKDQPLILFKKKKRRKGKEDMVVQSW